MAALVDRFGGKGGDPEMLQRIVNDSFINVSRGIGPAGYFAEQDAPILVSFAANYPGGDRYLRQYIAIHSGISIRNSIAIGHCGSFCPISSGIRIRTGFVR